MLDRFRAHLAESGLMPDGVTVLVGYSGGADSTCLLHLMKSSGIDVLAAHLHHGQRADADQEMKLCEAFCIEQGIPFMAGRADVPTIAANLGIGLEEAGRHARYEFFEQAAWRAQCDLIATAHTLDDQVETILLNLTRGCGLSGAAGIPVSRGNIIRPLLPFRRTETRTYCDEHGFWTHDDPANSDLNFSRARMRHRVLPELRSMNPAVDSALQRFSQIATEEDRFLDGMAAAALEQAEIPLNGPLRFLTQDVEVAIDLEILGALPPVLFKRALRLLASVLGAQIDFDATLDLSTALVSDPKGSRTAEGGKVVFEWDQNKIHARNLQVDEPFRHPLTVPGETESEDFGWKLTAEPDPPQNYPRPPASLDVVIDANATHGNLYFRTAADGDSIQPLGMAGTKKLSDLLCDMNLTLAAKRRLPIICDMVGPIWVPGGAIADRVKVTAGSIAGLRLRFEPNGLR